MNNNNCRKLNKYGRYDKDSLQISIYTTAKAVTRKRQNMQLKEINRNKMVEHKKRLERRKKAIESDVKEVTTQEKTARENLVIKKETIKKRAIDKRTKKERQKVPAEKVIDDARKGKINIEKNYLGEEQKVVITKEERTKRFKRLHTIARDMMKRWNG